MNEGKKAFVKRIVAFTGISLLFLALSCGKPTPADDVACSLSITAINGSVTKIPDKTTYVNGDVVTLTAVADSGYVFLSWNGDASGKIATTSLIMDGNKSVTANFAVSTAETVTDADGNAYTAVKIGIQVWTVENLRATKYNDGSAIPLVTDSAAWEALTTPGYCYYNNTANADSIQKFGALYNWHVVNTGKLAPAGWHVPSDAEWDSLQNYLIANGYNWDGTTTGNKIAKSMAAKTDWNTHTSEGAIGNDLTINNSTGFSALPGGLRIKDYNFRTMGQNGHWWSASERDASGAYYRYLNYNFYGLQRMGSLKTNGYSVRLVKDI